MGTGWYVNDLLAAAALYGECALGGKCESEEGSCMQEIRK